MYEKESLTYGNTYAALKMEEMFMKMIPVTTARANIYRLLEEVCESHEPYLISGKNGNAVLLSEEDWHSIEETLYLSTVPGLSESVLQAAGEKKEETAVCERSHPLKSSRGS